MYLLKNVRLYTGDAIYQNGAVLIDGNVILYAGDEVGMTAPPLNGKKITVLDGAGGICMPGLCNAHTHAAMVYLRGVGSDLPLYDWLNRVVPIENKYTPDMIYTGTTLAIMEMLRYGVTAFADMYYHMESAIHAARDSKIRANLCRGSSSLEGVACHNGWHRDYDNPDGLIRIYTGLHAEYTSDPSIAAAVAETARELHTGIHVHVSETEAEVRGCIERHGVTPVEYFARLGLFDSPALAAHCVHVTDDDIRILKEHNVTAVHCPASNMKLASGIARVRRLAEEKINIAIGTDGAASNDTLDMFREMRLASLLSKVSTGDASSLPADNVIKMATENGAQAMGFDKVGKLAAGYKADLILLRGDALHLAVDDIAAAIVYSACGADVRMTMVDGKILYCDGEYATIDAERAIFEGRAIKAALYNQ